MGCAVTVLTVKTCTGLELELMDYDVFSDGQVQSLPTYSSLISIYCVDAHIMFLHCQYNYLTLWDTSLGKQSMHFASNAYLGSYQGLDGTANKSYKSCFIIC